MVRCSKGHDHPSIDAVKACFGVGTATFSPRETGKSTFATNLRARDLPVSPRSGQYGTSLDRATEKQAKYIKDLLGHAKLRPVGWEPEQMTRDSASQAITELKAYLNHTGPLPRVPVAHVGQGPTPTPTTAPTREPYPDVPAGHYATISATGNNDFDFWRVDRPEEGQWKGRTFVKRVIGGKPDKNVYRQTARDALKAILAEGIEVTRTRYGTEIGQCWKCNRHLTDETSRALGIGPDCRSK